LFRPAEPDLDLGARLGLLGHKVFLYAGTHGLAQGLDVILDAARKTNDPDVLYVLAGEGAEKDRLVAKAKAQGIENVKFVPNQPKAAMPALLNLAYATIIPLKRLDLFKSALPSKMFEAMATARPIIASLWGEAAGLIETSGGGIVVEPEDSDALCEAVERLARDESLAGRLGQSGRTYVMEHFERAGIASRFADLLLQAAHPTA
jgi:glycosyltransferase involved in cell wall biosynthesis